MSIITDLIGPVLDKILPDANVAAEGKIKLLEMEKNGELEELKGYFDLLKTEAASDDNYTRRARPTALYVIYVLLCWGLLCSIVALVSPTKAQIMLDVFTGFFGKMPDSFYNTVMMMFGIYSGARTFEKLPEIKAKVQAKADKK